MTFRSVGPLLDETAALLLEARRLVQGSLEVDRGTGDSAVRAATGAPPETSALSVLSLYDELRARLGSIDDGRLQGLLTRIAANIERLGGLASEVDRMRGLRRSLTRIRS